MGGGVSIGISTDDIYGDNEEVQTPLNIDVVLTVAEFQCLPLTKSISMFNHSSFYCFGKAPDL